MNEEIMLDEVQEVPHEGRPVFLTVLCILTWVWSGLISVIGGIISYAMSGFIVGVAKSQNEKNIKAFEKIGDSSLKDMMKDVTESNMELLDYTGSLSLVGIGTGLACVLGAILMFKLKKIGFFIYSLSTVAYVFLVLYVTNFNMSASINALVYGVIGIVFIILYGVNLKHMKN